MEQQLPENMKVLRLFGAEKDALESLLTLAKGNKGVKIQCMKHGAEALLLLEAVTRSGSATQAVLSGWQDQVTEKCGDALYGTGETTLPQAMVKAFLEDGSLLACVDATTSAFLEEKLGAIAGIDSVYDFGAHSHAHPKIGRKIAMGSSFAKKYPTQTAQQVAGMVKATYQYSGADFALAILPIEDQSHLIFVGDKTGYALRRVAKNENFILWALDMLRRAVLGKQQATGTIYLSYGAKMPAFAAVEDASEEAEPFVIPSQAEFDAPPPPQAAKRAGGTIGFAFLWMVIFALLAIVALYFYTGGDIASLWYDTGLNRFNVSSATLL